MSIFKSVQIQTSNIEYLLDNIYRIETPELQDILSSRFQVKILAVEHVFINPPDKLGAGDKVNLYGDIPQSLPTKETFKKGAIKITSDEKSCVFSYKNLVQELIVVFERVNDLKYLKEWISELGNHPEAYACIFLYVANRFRAASAISEKEDTQRELITKFIENLRKEGNESIAINQLCEYLGFSWGIILLCDQIKANIVPVVSSDKNLLPSLKGVRLKRLNSYKEIFEQGDVKPIVVDLNHTNECNCKVLFSLGARCGVYIRFGHEPEIGGGPRGVLALYHKKAYQLDKEQKTAQFLQYIAREIAAWMNEKDELIERIIVEKTVASAEQACLKAETSGINKYIFTSVLQAIERHLQEAFVKIRASIPSSKPKLGVLIEGKSFGALSDLAKEVFQRPGLKSSVIVYGQNIEEEESVAIWFPENDKSFPLFVTSSLFNLSLVRIRIFETLRLILKLLYRLIMVEQSRMAWTLSTIHEVRQPLQGLVAIADEIQRLTKIHTVSRREIRFWAEDMETGIWRLKVLLRSLDHLAGVDDVIPNNKEMFLYEDVIRPLRRSVIGIAEMHGLKVSEPINFDIIPKIVCDPELLSMIFYNLLLNAIKYSRKNSEISIFCGKTEDDYWIQVENEGVEILKDEVEKIFIKGYRGKNAKKIMWGLGIGLSVCQTIASRLKCRILLISRGGPQGKVIFRLYIPKGLNYESFNC